MEELNTSSDSRVMETSPGKDCSSFRTPTERMSPSATPLIRQNNRAPVPYLPTRHVPRRKLIFNAEYSSVEQPLSFAEELNKPLRGRPSARDLVELHRLGADCKFKCDMCPMGFQRKKSLATHMLTHSAEKKHDCSYPECNKRFTQNSHLTTHWRVHTREKPFICTANNCISRSTFKRGKCLHHPGSPFMRQDETTEDVIEKLTCDQENMSETEITWIFEHITKKRDNIGKHQLSPDVLIGARNLLLYANNYHAKNQNQTDNF